MQKAGQAYPQSVTEARIYLAHQEVNTLNILVNYLDYQGGDQAVSKRPGVLVGTECDKDGQVYGIIIDSQTKRFRAHPINLVEYNGEFLDEDRDDG